MNKYSIGQSVYWVCLEENYGDSMVYPDALVVNRISVDHLGYHYSVLSPNEDIIDWCREEDLFLNKEDAVKESKKRNRNIELFGI